MKSLLTCQEMMTILQEIYYVICIIKIIINSLGQTYREKEIQIFLNKLSSWEKLEEDDGATMFFIGEKHQKTILNFSLDSSIASE